jgi:3-(3-hydroxy-phenyl)propionate hydroxylase
MDDAPLRGAGGAAAWLLDALDARFHLLVFAGAARDLDRAAIESLAPSVAVHLIVPERLPGVDVAQLIDHRGVLARRCDARPGTTYLVRPDQHVTARWRALDADAVRAALDRALARPAQTAARPDA